MNHDMYKKRNQIIFIFTVVILLIYTSITIIPKSFRYESPTTAFEKTKDYGSVLLDVLEIDNYSMIIFERKDGVLSSHITVKEKRGWTSLNNYYRATTEIVEDGFVQKRYVDGNTVISYNLLLETEDQTPVIYDDVSTQFVSNVYTLKSGRIMYCGFGVISGDQKSYSIYADDIKITFE